MGSNQTHCLAAAIIFLTLFSASAVMPAESPATEPQIDLAFETRLKMLRNPNNPLETRRLAADMLIDMKRPQATAALLEILKEQGDSEAQLAVIEALAGRNDPMEAFLQPLVNIVLAGDAELKNPAINALAGFRNPAVVHQLTSYAADATQPTLKRLSAIEALGSLRIHAKDAAEALVRLLEDASDEVRGASVRALANLTGKRFASDVKAWKSWWREVHATDDQHWLLQQIRLLTRKDRSDAEQLRKTEEALIKALVQLNRIAPKNVTETSRIVQEYLASDLPALRRAAVQLIKNQQLAGQTVDAATLAALRKLILDPNPAVRYEAVTVIADSGDQEAVALLIEQLDKKADSAAVREAMLVALGQLGQEAVLPKVLEHLQSPLAPVASGAAKAIEKIFRADQIGPGPRRHTAEALLQRYELAGPEQVALRSNLLSAMAAVADITFEPLFRQALQADRPDLRFYAARGIGALGRPELAPLLARNLDDPNPGVRAELAGGLARLTSEDRFVVALVARLDPDIETDKQVQQVTWQAIREMISRWPLSKQMQWAKQLTQARQILTDQRKTELFDYLAAQLQAAGPNLAAEQRIKLARALGFLLADTNGMTKALKQFRQAVQWASESADHDAGKLAAGIAQTMIDQGKPLPLLQGFLAQCAGQLDGPQLVPMARMLADRMDQLRQAQNPSAANRLRQAMPKPFLEALPEATRRRLSPPQATQPVETPAASKPSN